MKKITCFGLLSLFLFIFSPNTFSQTFNGYAIYGPQNSQSVFLIDDNGDIAHTWSTSINGNYAVFLKDDGNIIRQGVSSSATLKGAAYGGIIQELDKDANVVWEFTFSTSTEQAHHDFAVLPNGNVILTAWELKTGAEMSAAGYASSTEKWPTHLIEVQRDGSGGKIVWEWHIWDHLIQDVDENKPNYGVVADHPELMDINVSTGTGGGRPGRDGDWFHVNGIDYNAELDQLVFTSRNASELFIIDHSTTTAEAASHSGGNAGKGGDFLFRYGNPANFGSTGTQVIPAACHDPRWIKKGRPYEGYIQFFNNSGGSGGSSVVDAIKPVMHSDGYNYEFSSGTFQPTAQQWRHECRANSTGQSASDRMSNGNVFVNVSRQYMYEVDSNDNVVWQYSAETPKAFRNECQHPGIIALLNNPCSVNSVNTVGNYSISLFPNPSSGQITINGLNSSEFELQIFDVLGKQVFESSNKRELDISHLTNGNYFVQILSNHTLTTQKIAVVH